MSITDAARIDALFKKLQARTNTGTSIALASEASSISHVYSTQMGALPVPTPQPSDADIAASYPWIVKQTAITYNTPLAAPSYRAYKDSRVTNIIPYYTVSVSVAGNALSASQYILDFDTGAIVIYTTIAGAPTITFYQYKEDFATPRNLRTEAGKFVTGWGTALAGHYDYYDAHYPVLFYVDTYKYPTASGTAYAAKPFSLTIHRSVDEDSAGRGGLFVEIVGNLSLNGAGAPSLQWKFVNQAGSGTDGRGYFIAGVELMTKNPGVVVWLRGRCTYHYYGTNLASTTSIQAYYANANTAIRSIANVDMLYPSTHAEYSSNVNTTTGWTVNAPYADAASLETYNGKPNTPPVPFTATTAAWDSVTGLLVNDSVQTAYTVASRSCAPNAVDAFEIGSVIRLGGSDMYVKIISKPATADNNVKLLINTDMPITGEGTWYDIRWYSTKSLHGGFSSFIVLPQSVIGQIMATGAPALVKNSNTELILGALGYAPVDNDIVYFQITAYKLK